LPQLETAAAIEADYNVQVIIPGPGGKTRQANPVKSLARNKRGYTSAKAAGVLPEQPVMALRRFRMAILFP
jgi:hypothetical protein